MTINNSNTKNTLKELEVFGYSVIKNVIPTAECAKLAETLDKIEEERRKSKDVFLDDQRVILWNIHQSHPDQFLSKINLPEIMEIMQAVLKEKFTLTSFGAIRNTSNQAVHNVHIDSRVPMRDFEHTFQALAMICITDFTVKNGSTGVWPLSHRSGLNPKDAYPVGTALPGKLQVEAKAGDVVVFLGQTWHDVSPNISNEKRWGIISYYSRWWVKPTFDYTQCGPELFNRLSDEQKILFGFTSRPPSHYMQRGNTVTKLEDLPKDYFEALKS